MKPRDVILPAILVAILAGAGLGCTAEQGAETAEAALSSGSIDTTFGAAGTATLSEAAFKAPLDVHADITYVTELRDGRLMLLSSAHVVPGEPDRDRAVVLTKGGAIDPTFGNQGVFEPGGRTRLYSAFELSSGGVLLRGHDEQGPVIVRLRPDGTIDSSFGRNGVLTKTELGVASRYVAIDPGEDGGIYVEQLPRADASDTRLTIDRFDLQGHRDPSSTSEPFFTGDQTQAITSPPLVGSQYRNWSGWVVAAYGGIYVGEHVYASEKDTYVRVRRLTKSGVDTSWATGGEVHIPNDFSGFDFVPLPDRRLMVTLSTDSARGSDLVTVDSTGSVGPRVSGEGWRDAIGVADVSMTVDREAGTSYVFRDLPGKTTLSRFTLSGPDNTFPTLTFVRNSGNHFVAPFRVAVGKSGFYTFGNFEQGELRLTKYVK